MRRQTKIRFAALFTILLLLVPVGLAALDEEDGGSQSADDLRRSASNVTFITTQGGSVEVYEHAGVAVAVHTPTREVIWRNDEYRRYMDIDPLDQDRVLFVAGERTDGDSFRRVAVVINWRTGDTVEKFRVPPDTHDIDYIGDGRYVVADKFNPHTRGDERNRNGRVFVYNATAEEVTWEYVFIDHYPPFPQAGGQETGYTHLNDVDLIDNGSAFLVSPRNFDRVMAIDRRTKETRWTLGEEDNYAILNEQHNPVVVDREPLTVLVADSGNDRIVEYQRTESGTWELTWSYSKGLRWPRDADRLPNGNTLITDTLNDRAIEVTPDRDVVWEFTVERGTYDVERLRYGDEPAGPPMTKFTDQFDAARQSDTEVLPTTALRLEASYNRLYKLVGAWLLPGFAGPGEFGFVLLATVLGIAWLGVETVIRVPFERVDPSTFVQEVDHRVGYVVGGGSLLVGTLVLWTIVGEESLTGVHAATALLLANIGYARLRSWIRDQGRVATDRLDIAIRLGLFVASLTVAGLLVYSQVTTDGLVLLYGGLGIAVVATAATLVEE